MSEKPDNDSTLSFPLLTEYNKGAIDEEKLISPHHSSTTNSKPVSFFRTTLNGSQVLGYSQFHMLLHLEGG
ncbi:hypothetical protein PIB30_008770 [Stylosanthes scabra]|uniref:Uncharacterized protein n=1 Tax=Stylosanthes scabra TaxID=79078 RepID=A0ABU6W311_9FABA|nr:hypothetical protein [Stylosanthes scabra]